tara:strand:+ start:522 stop:959 length:438 start_codon:yes stop_codon:yes gene_type:complete
MTQVEFTNVFKTQVIDNIQKLIKETIPSVPLFFDEHKGQESFLLEPTSDSFLEFASNAHIRTFTCEISYQIRSGGEMTRDGAINRLTNRSEQLKRIFFNNRDLVESNQSQWYNGKVMDIIFERDEEEEQVKRFVLTFECNVNEVV